jgi:hypothetical protein
MNFRKKINKHFHLLVIMTVIGAWFLYVFHAEQWVSEENERLAKTAPNPYMHSNKLRLNESSRSQSIQGKVQADSASKPY